MCFHGRRWWCGRGFWIRTLCFKHWHSIHNSSFFILYRGTFSGVPPFSAVGIGISSRSLLSDFKYGSWYSRSCVHVSNYEHTVSMSSEAVPTYRTMNILFQCPLKLCPRIELWPSCFNVLWSCVHVSNYAQPVSMSSEAVSTYRTMTILSQCPLKLCPRIELCPTCLNVLWRCVHVSNYDHPVSMSSEGVSTYRTMIILFQCPLSKWWRRLFILFLEQFWRNTQHTFQRHVTKLSDPQQLPKAWFLKLWYAYHYWYANHWLLVRGLNKKIEIWKRINILKNK
jgi:hypothetical protein